MMNRPYEFVDTQTLRHFVEHEIDAEKSEAERELDRRFTPKQEQDDE